MIVPDPGPAKKRPTITFPPSATEKSIYAVTLSPFFPNPGQSVIQMTSPIHRPSMIPQNSLNSAGLDCILAFLSATTAFAVGAANTEYNRPARQPNVNNVVGMIFFISVFLLQRACSRVGSSNRHLSCNNFSGPASDIPQYRQPGATSSADDCYRSTGPHRAWPDQSRRQLGIMSVASSRTCR